MDRGHPARDRVAGLSKVVMPLPKSAKTMTSALLAVEVILKYVESSRHRRWTSALHALRGTDSK